MKMKKLGLQLILELYGCNQRLLNDESKISHCILGAAEELGATILRSYFHKFHPQGITGIVVISESHLSIHTWPEHNYAAVDVFTCGEGTRPYEATDYIIKRLEPEKHHIQDISRGLYAL
jgi:S-adenosylmethionine decarboxylase